MVRVTLDEIFLPSALFFTRVGVGDEVCLCIFGNIFVYQCIDT
jgi:hypothetical protein